MTCDTGNVTHDGGWKFSKNFSSLALTVWDKWCFEDWEEKDDFKSTQLMSDKGVCRTAPATPGLLNIQHYPNPFYNADIFIVHCHSMIHHLFNNYPHWYFYVPERIVVPFGQDLYGMTAKPQGPVTALGSV